MFRTLGEAMMSAIAKGMVDGEAGIAVPAVSQKGPERYAPAKSGGQILPANKDHANREMIIAPPNGSPRPAVVISLVVDNSGRETHEGEHRLPAFRRSPGGRARETVLKLVHARSSIF
jgi:hypothetical protein